MANRIKGITIEIGGDTTKLDKALSGTNKQISTTQKNLKDVERLLKMDPGNTELLAQKQRLLGDAVTATKDKLNTLREAAKNADAALAKGKAYDEKYEPLKQSIEETSKTLDGLRDNQERMKRDLDSGKISTKTYEKFSQTLEETEGKLEELQRAKKNLDKEFKGRIDQSQYDAIQRELIETKQEFKDTEKEAKAFNSTLGQLAANTADLSNKAGKVSNAFAPVTAGVLALGAAAVATVPATEEFRADMSMLEQNAKNAGVSLRHAKQAFETFNAVSGETDSSIEAVSNLLQAGATTSNLQKAVENLAGAAERFPDTLKVESLADSLQETVKTGEATGQFAELLDRLGVNVEAFNYQLSWGASETARFGLAMDVLTREGLADAHQAWAQQNEDLVANRDANLALQESMSELAEQILPLVTMVTEFASAFLDWFNELPGGAKIAITAFAGLLAAVSPIAGVVAQASTAFAALSVAQATAGAASTAAMATFGKWLLIIAAVAAAVAGLIALFSQLFSQKDELDGMTSSTRGTGFGTTVRSGGSALSSYSLAAADIPHLASGTVVQPNNPFLAVLGDNTREQEIVAPYSTITQAVVDAIGGMGGRSASPRNVIVNMNLDGRTFARMIMPYLDGETDRLGVNLVR